MKEIYDQLKEREVRILTTTWMEIFAPMMNKWGSRKQNKYFNNVYKKFVSGEKIDSKKLNEETLKPFAQDGEPEGSENYGLEIFVCVDYLVNMYGEERAKAFVDFREQLLILIDLLDEDMMITKYSSDKLLEKIKPYVNEALLNASKNEDITKELYEKSNLRKIFFTTFDNIVEVLLNKSNGDKEMLINDIKNNISDILSTIIDVVTTSNNWNIKVKKTRKTKKKVYNFVTGKEANILIDSVLEKIRKDHYIDALECILGNRNGFGCEYCIRYADNFSPKDYRYFGEKGVAFISDPGCGSIYEVADIVVISEEEYYNILCVQKKKYSFTKEEIKKVDGLLVEIKSFLT